MLHSLDSLALHAHCYSPMLYLFSVAIPDEKGEIMAGDGGIRGYLHGDGGVGPGHVHQVGYRNNPRMGIMVLVLDGNSQIMFALEAQSLLCIWYVHYCSRHLRLRFLLWNYNQPMHVCN